MAVEADVEMRETKTNSEITATAKSNMSASFETTASRSLSDENRAFRSRPISTQTASSSSIEISPFKSFHLRTYADRIEVNKFQVGSLVKLYIYSKEKITMEDSEFEENNTGPSSGARTPMAYVNKAQKKPVMFSTKWVMLQVKWREISLVELSHRAPILSKCKSDIPD